MREGTCSEDHDLAPPAAVFELAKRATTNQPRDRPPTQSTRYTFTSLVTLGLGPTRLSTRGLAIFNCTEVVRTHELTVAASLEFAGRPPK